MKRKAPPGPVRTRLAFIRKLRDAGASEEDIAEAQGTMRLARYESVGERQKLAGLQLLWQRLHPPDALEIRAADTGEVVSRLEVPKHMRLSPREKRERARADRKWQKRMERLKSR